MKERKLCPLEISGLKHLTKNPGPDWLDAQICNIQFLKSEIKTHHPVWGQEHHMAAYILVSLSHSRTGNSRSDSGKQMFISITTKIKTCSGKSSQNKPSSELNRILYNENKFPVWLLLFGTAHLFVWHFLLLPSAPRVQSSHAPSQLFLQ